MTPRTVKADAAKKQGRLDAAKQFTLAAEIVHEFVDDAEEDLTNAYVTLCVHAGIAAADVICAARLGEYARGDIHNEAVGLLAKADKAAAKDLDVLLGLKTMAGYGTTTIRGDRVKRATRAMSALMEAAKSA